jgi:hypothetical protein
VGTGLRAVPTTKNSHKSDKPQSGRWSVFVCRASLCLSSWGGSRAALRTPSLVGARCHAINRAMEPRILTIALAALLVLSADSPSQSGRRRRREDRPRRVEQPVQARQSRVGRNKIKLFGARNEIIAFQVIVEAGPSGIAQLSATLPQLISEEGQKIVYRPPGRDSSESVGRPIQLFAVNYLNVTKARARVGISSRLQLGRSTQRAGSPCSSCPKMRGRVEVGSPRRRSQS